VAISVALPAFAQRSIPDPQLREKVVAAIKKHIAALDKNDAAAGAANFTENGILVTPDGPIFGRESIEKYYEGEFKQVQLSDNLAPVDDDSPHAIGSAGKESGQPENGVHLYQWRNRHTVLRLVVRFSG
jgi:SnoaL-like domain